MKRFISLIYCIIISICLQAQIGSIAEPINLGTLKKGQTITNTFDVVYKDPYTSIKGVHYIFSVEDTATIVIKLISPTSSYKTAIFLNYNDRFYSQENTFASTEQVVFPNREPLIISYFTDSSSGIITTSIEIKGSDTSSEGGEGGNTTDPEGGSTDPTPEGKGITVNYEYNVRSWTTNISSPHFSQKLYYNESNGNNTPQYNGNISAIEWNKGVNNSNRAYNFSYDQLSRLTAANYTGQANEKYGTSYSYDKHGNMRTLDRFGKINNDDKPDSYGAVDQLSFTYNGNQLKTITDGGANTNINESADFKSYAPEGTETHYTFNRNGAMTQDLNKGITNIDYNSLNLPISMDISNGMNLARNEYLYTASGVKLQVKHSWNKDFTTAATVGSGMTSNEMDTTKVIDYVGNKIYENGELKKILVDGGYYDYEKEEYFFYIQDHLGNNRVVVNQNDSVVQRSDYYPFGMEFADNSGNDQPYKYNGKELDKMHGLNMYDYSARYTDPAYGRFTSVDPHAESYYSWSPYHYAANNPLKITDPTGMDWFVNNETGNLIFMKNVSVLTEELSEIYGFGDINQYENLGADNMFGDNVAWGEDANLLDYSYANMTSDSESFMNEQGYAKAERVITQEKTTLETGGDMPGATVRDVRQTESLIKKSTTYVKPENLNTKKVLNSEFKRYPFNNVQIFNYEYTVPSGENYNKVNNYGKHTVKVTNKTKVNEVLKILKKIKF